MEARTLAVFCTLIAAAGCALAVSAPPAYEPVGGANAPTSAAPPTLVVGTAEMQAEGFTLRVPSGDYHAPAGGAPNYRVPGPIVSFKGPDGSWRGHGYLETYARLVSFKGEVSAGQAVLKYVFENDARYDVTLKVDGRTVRMDEESTLGPRNFFVFDAYYGWEPSSAFVIDPAGRNHAFLYLPCHYDKNEAMVTPSTNTAPALGAIAILHPDTAKRDVAAFFARSPSEWRNADRMAFALWQHRQLPGDPASRHFLGPETKSDSTPNPRTAPLLGRSLYEGHVTVEFSLGTGRRATGFMVYQKPVERDSIPGALRQAVRDAGR